MGASRHTSRMGSILCALCLLGVGRMVFAQPPAGPDEPSADPSAAGSSPSADPASPTPDGSPPPSEPSADESAAAAGQPAESDPASQAKARAVALLHEGNQLAAEGDYGAALQRFQAAYAAYPSVKLLLNIGTSLRHAGRNAEAARTYERYLADPNANPARFEELRRIVDEIDQVVGWLKIEVRPTDARIRLDGTLLEGAASTVRRRVDPGQHAVVAERVGYRTVVRTVKVERRAEAVVRIDLAKPERPPPLIIEQDGVPTQHIVAYAVGGVGIGGLATGAVFGILSLSTNAEADERCSAVDPTACDEEGVQLGETAQTQGTVSTILLAAGGGLLATGLVIWLTTPTDEDAASPDEQGPAVSLSPFSRDLRSPGAELRVTW